VVADSDFTVSFGWQEREGAVLFVCMCFTVEEWWWWWWNSDNGVW